MDKLKEVDWRGIYKTASAKVKKYTLNLTDLELKVEDATNSETWGPHGSVMNEIADSAFDPENYRQIMGVLARRLQEKEENWRMCYKALLLLEHLIKHGPSKIVSDVQSSASVLDRLQNFEYKDPNMKDHGVNVRHRAKEILQLVNNPDRLREERDKAKANRAKYRGVSADQMRGGGSSSFSGSSDHFSSTTSGSLYPASTGGSGGALAGSFKSLAGGGGGGGGVYGAGSSRRTDSYDETSEGAHYISKRGGGGGEPAGLDTRSGGAGSSSSFGGGGGGAAAPAAAGGGSGGDAMAATRARIERLKLAEEKPAADEKKRLTDVRVNPKIAASLGLKLPTRGDPAAAAAVSLPTLSATAPAAAAAEAPASALDLLGGLEEAAPVAGAAVVAAPAQTADVFDPFGASAAPPSALAPAPAQQQSSGGGGGWDAFGESSVQPQAAAARPGPASQLDMLGGLDFGAPAAPLAAAAPAFSHQAAIDPFAAFSSTPPSTATQMPFTSAAKPAAAVSPTAPLPSVAAGVPSALPEDMFSGLTGIGHRSQQPMSASGSGPWAQAPAAAPPPAPAGMLAGTGGGGSPGLGAGWGLPSASPPSPGGGFGTFNDAPQPPSNGTSFASSGGMGIGIGGLGVPVSVPRQQAQQAGQGYNSQTGGHGRTGSVDFGSLSYSGAPAQGGATAADPFADLLK